MNPRPDFTPLPATPKPDPATATQFQSLNASTLAGIDGALSGQGSSIDAMNSFLTSGAADLLSTGLDIAAGAAELDAMASDLNAADITALIPSLENLMASVGQQADAGLAAIGNDPNLSFAFDSAPPALGFDTSILKSIGRGTGGGSTGTGGGVTPPPVIPPPIVPNCPDGFAAQSDGNCHPTRSGGIGTPPLIPPSIPITGGEVGTITTGVVGTIITAVNIAIPVIGAFLMFNWLFGSNWNWQLETFQAYIANWAAKDPLAVEIYATTSQLNGLKADLQSFSGGDYARNQLIEAIARVQLSLDALVAQAQKNGIPPLPKK